MSMKSISPCKPAAPYLGGKTHLAKAIIELINQTEHTSYAECFVGMGGVFFRREFSPKTEIINDYNKEVSNLFRILQTHYVAFMDMLKWQITSRSDFERLIETNSETLTDMQRAAKFLYLQRTSFGGKVTGQHFGVQREGTARFDITKLTSILEDVHERLSSVVIECLDYKPFIKRYDHPKCLFYLDPPYYECENDYGKNMFSRDEFAVMADLLSSIKGKFILSLNDHPEVRKTFKSFNISDVTTIYSVGGRNKSSRAKEILITNYVPNALLF